MWPASLVADLNISCLRILTAIPAVLFLVSVQHWIYAMWDTIFFYRNCFSTNHIALLLQLLLILVCFVHRLWISHFCLATYIHFYTGFVVMDIKLLSCMDLPYKAEKPSVHLSTLFGSLDLGYGCMDRRKTSSTW